MVSAEEEADNAIAEHSQQSAQPVKSISPAEQELLSRSGPLCMLIAKHNWLITRTLASCLGREEYVLLARESANP